MSYQRVGSLALRAYPASLRSARGEEMLGTLLDAGEDSTGAFMRGCASLLIGGLRERVYENARIGTGRLIADGFCLAAVLWSFWELLLWTPFPQGYGQFWAVTSLVLLAAVLAFALTGRDRLGGLCGVVLAAHFGFLASGHAFLQSVGTSFFLDHWLGPLICYTVMMLKPRSRSHTPRKLLWLIPVALLVVFVMVAHVSGPGLTTYRMTPIIIPELAVTLVLMFGVPLLGILLLPIDPRLAIASALLWADIAAHWTLGHTRLGLVTLPVVLLAVCITVARQQAVIRRLRA